MLFQLWAIIHNAMNIVIHVVRYTVRACICVVICIRILGMELLQKYCRQTLGDPVNEGIWDENFLFGRI